MDSVTYTTHEADAPHPAVPTDQDAVYAKRETTLDEINAKLDLLLASQGIETNKEVVQ